MVNVSASDGKYLHRVGDLREVLYEVRGDAECGVITERAIAASVNHTSARQRGVNGCPVGNSCRIR